MYSLSTDWIFEYVAVLVVIVIVRSGTILELLVAHAPDVGQIDKYAFSRSGLHCTVCTEPNFGCIITASNPPRKRSEQAVCTTAFSSLGGHQPHRRNVNPIHGRVSIEVSQRAGPDPIDHMFCPVINFDFHHIRNHNSRGWRGLDEMLPGQRRHERDEDNLLRSILGFKLAQQVWIIYLATCMR